MRDYHIDGTLPDPKSGVIFCFGSNDRGWHGAGAARIAKERFGAIPYHGVGPMGQSYAIPTKSYDEARRKLVSKNIGSISLNIQLFCEYTRWHPELRFFVTAVGCGLAGYSSKDIAPHFKRAINCSFPEEWDIYLESNI